MAIYLLSRYKSAQTRLTGTATHPELPLAVNGGPGTVRFYRASVYAGTMDESDRTFLRRIADYQFGRDVGQTLFPDGEDLTVTTTSSGRPRQVRADEGRLVTYGTDGRFTLGTAGGRRLQSVAAETPYRVVVGDESEPFVREGRNVFAKFVDTADAGIRPRDEAVVEHEDGRLLAVGRAELSGAGMLDFGTGMAVYVRDSIE
jgi:uncharacterized protein with predicted RNA binding PUA domain